jgi:hypothetical protein
LGGPSPVTSARNEAGRAFVFVRTMIAARSGPLAEILPRLGIDTCH